MTKILLVTALKRELKRILSIATIRNLVEKGNIEVAVSGLGNLTASYINNNSNTLKQFNQIVNCGICGSVNNEIKLFQPVFPKKFIFENQEVVIDSTGLSIITVKHPVFKKSEKLKLEGDLIDMESFYFAYFCKKNNIKFSAIKIVSDDLNTHEDKQNHIKNINKSLNILAKEVEVFIS